MSRNLLSNFWNLGSDFLDFWPFLAAFGIPVSIFPAFYEHSRDIPTWFWLWKPFNQQLKLVENTKTRDGYGREAIWGGFAFQLCQEKEAYYYSLASTLTMTTLF